MDVYTLHTLIRLRNNKINEKNSKKKNKHELCVIKWYRKHQASAK